MEAGDVGNLRGSAVPGTLVGLRTVDSGTLIHPGQNLHALCDGHGFLVRKVWGLGQFP